MRCWLLFADAVVVFAVVTAVGCDGVAVAFVAVVLLLLSLLLCMLLLVLLLLILLLLLLLCCVVCWRVSLFVCVVCRV